MTSKLTVLGVVIALLLSGTLAFAAVPSEAVGNDGAGNEGDGAHEISECTTITEPGQYEVVSDIEHDGTSLDPCIEVKAEDVSIDGNGHTVAGQDRNGTGILVELHDNVTVSNVTVTSFREGLETAAQADVTVVHSRFEGNEIGMSAHAGAIFTVKDSEVVDSASTGIFADQSTLRVVDSELVDNGGSGISTAAAAAVFVRGSLVAGNTVGIDASVGDLVSENNTVRNNSELGISALHRFESTNDVVTGNGAGIRTGDHATVASATVADNSDYGIEIELSRHASAEIAISDSRIVDNAGDGVYISNDTDRFEENISIDDSTIADNDGLGVNNTNAFVVDALDNDWGSEDGPGSADDPDAPFEDPVTGALADGSGDEVSEHPEQPGVSNVHFTTEPPEDDEGDEREGDEDDERENDGDDQDDEDGQNGEDGPERPPEERAFQFDLAVGEVIEDIGESEDAYYGRQGRLVRATTMTADGSVTGHHAAPNASYSAATGDCDLMTSAVDYDSETGEASATFQLGDDADCEAVTVTFAAYELPGDDTTFVRAHADDQELIAYVTVTLEPGEEVTPTIDVDE